jgi:hypothetical protein
MPQASASRISAGDRASALTPRPHRVRDLWERSLVSGVLRPSFCSHDDAWLGAGSIDSLPRTRPRPKSKHQHAYLHLSLTCFMSQLAGWWKRMGLASTRLRGGWSGQRRSALGWHAVQSPPTPPGARLRGAVGPPRARDQAAPVPHGAWGHETQPHCLARCSAVEAPASGSLLKILQIIRPALAVGVAFPIVARSRQPARTIRRVRTCWAHLAFEPSSTGRKVLSPQHRGDKHCRSRAIQQPIAIAILGKRRAPLGRSLRTRPANPVAPAAQLTELAGQRERRNCDPTNCRPMIRAIRLYVCSPPQGITIDKSAQFSRPRRTSATHRTGDEFA